MKNLKTIILAVFAALVVFAALPEKSQACIITFEPSDVVVDENGEATVRVVLKWEHRRCVLDDDDVNIDYENIKELSNTGWKKIKRGLFENILKIKLTGDEGMIRVWRDCSKKGISEGILKIKKPAKKSAETQ